MTFASKVSKSNLSNCFLTRYKAPNGQRFVCVIKVFKQKIPMFKKKKSGDHYNILDYGQILALGLDGKFSDEVRKSFEKKYGVTLPETVK